MQISLDRGSLKKVTFLTGAEDTVQKAADVPAMIPFCDKILAFLNDASREIINDKRSRAYSDVVTFGFWIRRASTERLKERFEVRDGTYRMGKGMLFHIAPSNVPVNFAYSLAMGLLNGNSNIVRVPSKDYPQIEIIADGLNKALDIHPEMKPYVICVRYDRNQQVNDMFSSIADVRVVWGGDQTIAELRKSPLPPRSGEITFADRYSLAVIDSEAYMSVPDKEKIASDFYNDTYFSDQNACTSPRLVVWMGNQISEAKELFWEILHNEVRKKYSFQPIQGVNKLTKSFMIAAEHNGIKVMPHQDNLLVRVAVSEITDDIMNYRDNSGYFYEYDCSDIMDLRSVCNDKHCQTVAYFGDSEMLFPLLTAGVKGIDRIVPIGKTMDFDLIWDGYDLSSQLTRAITVQ